MSRRPRDPELASLLTALLERAEAVYGPSDGGGFLGDIVSTCLRYAGPETSRAELKLIQGALRDMRRAFRAFAPYRDVRKVAVFGSARTTPGSADWEQARRFSERIVERGWMVITGAGGGIMAAAQGGAGRDSSFGVNIRLPFEQDANAVIAGDPKLVNFRYFFTRKVTFIKEAHALALFPGGFGTHDEGFETLTLIQTGRSEILPMVFVDEPGGSYWGDWRTYVESHLRQRGLISDEDMALFRVTDDVNEAVDEVIQFYRNYQSSRFVGDQLVLRVRRAPGDEQLESLNDEFRDLLVRGRIEVGGPLEAEADDVPELPRIVLDYDRRRTGRLRRLIDRLNTLVSDAPDAHTPSPREVFERPLPPEVERAEEEEEGWGSGGRG